MNDANDDFQAAFVEEMGGTLAADPAPIPPAAPETPPAADPQVPAEPVSPAEPAEPAKDQGGDEKTDEEKEAELVANETEEETTARHEAEAAAAATAVEEPAKPLSKEDIAELLDSRDNASKQHVEQISQASREVIDKLYPEGIDKNVYDSDGRVIETAQDIVDRGLLKENGEPFTYEEAASFMLRAGQKMAENIEKLNDYAEDIAVKNLSLIESNQRVIAQYGDLIGRDGKPGTLPAETVKNLADTYISTQLEFDPTNSYITKMSMTPEAFYALALGPYKQINQQQSDAAVQAEAARKQAEADEQARLVAEQAERSGLPPQRGTSTVKSNTGDDFLDAFIDELATP